MKFGSVKVLAEVPGGQFRVRHEGRGYITYVVGYTPDGLYTESDDNPPVATLAEAQLLADNWEDNVDEDADLTD